MTSQAPPANSPAHEDKEKQSDEVQQHVVAVKDEAPEEFYVSRSGAFGPILSKLFDSGVEARGIERVPEDQRESSRTWNKHVPHYCGCQKEN